MHIFIMRHGEAGMHANSDAQRNLTAHGIEQAKQQGFWLSETATQIEKVIVSPYNRAQQTYQHLASTTKTALPNEIETWEAITPYGNTQVVLDYLTTLWQDGVASVLLVSHLPFVDDLVTALCQSTQYVSFHTGTIAEIEWQGKQGRLLSSQRAAV